MSAQIIGIGQITVVSNADAIGRVNIEWLSQCRAGTAGCGIAHMAYANVAHQSRHMLSAEHISRQTNTFADVNLTIMVGDNASGILTAMLQHSQGIIEPYINI